MCNVQIFVFCYHNCWWTKMNICNTFPQSLKQRMQQCYEQDMKVYHRQQYSAKIYMVAQKSKPPTQLLTTRVKSCPARLDFFVKSKCRNRSTIILSVGIKCSMRDMICDVSYCACPAKLRNAFSCSSLPQQAMKFTVLRMKILVKNSSILSPLFRRLMNNLSFILTLTISQLQAQKLMTSQIISGIEYLMPTAYILVVLLRPRLLVHLALMAGLNTRDLNAPLPNKCGCYIMLEKKTTFYQKIGLNIDINIIIIVFIIYSSDWTKSSLCVDANKSPPQAVTPYSSPPSITRWSHPINSHRTHGLRRDKMPSLRYDAVRLGWLTSHAMPASRLHC